jgi:hypothetical protein
VSAQTLALDGTERFDLALGEPLRPRQPANLGIERRDGREPVPLPLRIDAPSKRPTSWQEGSCRMCSSSCSRRNTLGNQSRRDEHDNHVAQTGGKNGAGDG